ncbi:MAG: RNA-binding domain-containing protein [Oligosphaeraceae bacterium]
MTIYDDIARRENVDVEFKLIPNENRIKYLKTAVAFANGKGGRLLFGIDNEGVIHGIANDKVYAEMDSITNSIVDACYPRIPFDAGIENINDKAIIVLDILPGSRPPYFVKAEGEKDGVYVRIGATTQRADDATRRELMFLSEGRSFDTEPCPKAKIDERRIRALCSSMYRLARLNCDSEVERKTVKRIAVEQLEAWNIISRVHDTWMGSNAYALLTGDAAFAIRLKCGLFRGNDKTIFLDRRDFVGSVPQLIEQGLEYILAKINRGCYFRGAFRHDRYELPPDALRELVINAFAHRSYLQHDAPIFIAIYDTRVEITSPGGLPRGQTPERALAGYSKIRNSALARALNYMRFMEEWGSGLRRANNVLNEYGLQPVSLVDTGFAVSMTVYRPSYHEPVNRDGEPVNEPVNRNGEPVNPADEPVNPNGEPVNARHTLEAVIYQSIITMPGISISSLMTRVGKSRATIKRTLAQLRMKRKIEFQGSPKSGGYYATASQE